MEREAALVWLKAVRDTEIRKNWRQVLEDVSKWLHSDPELQAAALQCVCAVLVPATPITDLAALLNDIHDKVAHVFTSTTTSILTLLTTSSGITSKNLPELVKLCEFLQQFVGSLLTCNEYVKANLPSSSSSSPLTPLLSTTLTATERVLHLCKEVETVYSWAFDHLVAQLGPLFKSTYSLLKVCVESLEVLHPEQARMEPNSVVQVICQLESLCGVVLNFDPSMVVLVWRGMGRLVCRVKAELPEGWSIQPIIAKLCVAMETKCAECVQCAPTAADEASNPVFSKLLRVCRFLGTLVVKLTQEFQQSSFEFAEVLFNMLLSTHSLIPPSLGARPICKAAQMEMECNVLVMREPLMSVLLESQPFLRALLHRGNVKEGQQVAWATCLCSLLKLFPKLPGGLQDFVMEEESSLETGIVTCQLLDALFTCVRMCYVELSLPVSVSGVMCNGQPQREVTLYEHLCTHVCSLVACLPARHFHTLERVLLRNVLGGELHCCLLASDTWAFLARWGTREVAHTHTNLMVKLVLLLPTSVSPTHLALHSLLRRMVGFLTPEQQTEFLHTHPPTSRDSLKLWSKLSVKAFPKQLHSEICQQIAVTSAKLMRDELRSGTPCYLAVHLALQSLVTVYELPASLRLLTPTVHNTTVAMAMQVLDMAARVCSSSTRNKLSLVLLCDSLHLTSLLLPLLQPQHTTKVFTSLYDLVTAQPPLPPALSSTQFLSQCSSLQVPPGIQAQVLQSLTATFQCLLSHSSWLVHHHAMEAFRMFAEVTPYADVVEQCIPSNMHDTVINFLSKIPNHSDEFSQQTWLLQCLEERERVVRERGTEEGEEGSADTKQCTGQLAMQNSGASEQECSERVRMLRCAWQGVEQCRGQLSPLLLEEVHKLGQGMVDFAHLQTASYTNR